MSTPALLYAAARVPRDAYGAPPRPRGNLHFCGGSIRALIGAGHLSPDDAEALFYDFYHQWSAHGPEKLSEAEVRA
jgi:hypothetical protein